MKEKVTVIVNLEEKRIIDIIFHRSILNVFLGKERLKSFHKKRFLGIPIQDFDAVIYDDVEDKWLYYLETELEVYTLMRRTKINYSKRTVPYIAHVLCLPSKEESDVSYQELEEAYQKNSS